MSEDESEENDKTSFGFNSAPLIFVALVTAAAVHLLMAAACFLNIARIRFLLCLSLFIAANKHEWITWTCGLLQGFEGHSLFSLTDLLAV